MEANLQCVTHYLPSLYVTLTRVVALLLLQIKQAQGCWHTLGHTAGSEDGVDRPSAL